MKKPLLVLLASGAGKNTYPFVSNKLLIPFCGKTLLRYTLDSVVKAGIKNMLISTNIETEEEVLLFKKSLRSKIKLATKQQKEALGMANALLNLEREIGDNPIIIKSAAHITETALLTEVIKRSQHTDMVITVKRVDHYFPGGYLVIKNNKACGIIEKPGEGNEPSEFICVTTHYFRNPKQLIESLKSFKSTKDNHFEQSITKVLNKCPSKYFEYTGDWKKIKYPFHVLEVAEYLLNRISSTYQDPTCSISSNATIRGNVYIDRGARVNENAVIIGPAYIGKNVIIGQNTLIRSSMIEEDSVIGFGSEICRSYIGPRCKLHHNYVGDSILESDINVGYGSCTANRRLDKENVSIIIRDKKISTNRRKFGAVIGKGASLGVYCTLMPGAVIKPYALVYPSTVVHQ